MLTRLYKLRKNKKNFTVALFETGDVVEQGEYQPAGKTAIKRNCRFLGWSFIQL